MEALFDCVRRGDDGALLALLSTVGTSSYKTGQIRIR